MSYVRTGFVEQRMRNDGDRHKQMKTLKPIFASRSSLPLSLRWRLLCLPFLIKTSRDHVVSYLYSFFVSPAKGIGETPSRRPVLSFSSDFPFLSH